MLTIQSFFVWDMRSRRLTGRFPSVPPSAVLRVRRFAGSAAYSDSFARIRWCALAQHPPIVKHKKLRRRGWMRHGFFGAHLVVASRHFPLQPRTKFYLELDYLRSRRRVAHGYLHAKRPQTDHLINDRRSQLRLDIPQPVFGRQDLHVHGLGAIRASRQQQRGAKQDSEKHEIVAPGKGVLLAKPRA